ncbi:hypothetical protein AX16_005118 [Volvariella volvacea WC 439]|nr:hypothetical protein AX16_005118 [Volvariella volvacea WC 439]
MSDRTLEYALHGPDTPEDVEAERARLDEEIAQLELRLKQLRQRRNALAPVSRIPDEILSDIMLESQAMVLQEDQAYWQAPCPRSLSWIGMTQVSHHWRTVALQYPLLWTTISIPFMSPQCIDELFIRSNSAPLSLFIEHPIRSAYRTETQPMLTTNMNRVSSLIFVGDDMDLDEDYSLDFSKSPLKHFEVYNCPGFYDKWTPTFKLKHLCIVAGRFNASLLSDELVELKIKEPDDDSMPHAAYLYRILSSLKNLRQLTLDKALWGSQTTVELPDIILPSLVSLELYQEFDKECANFLSHLTSPNLANLDMSLKTTDIAPLVLVGDAVIKFIRDTLVLKSLSLPSLLLRMQAEPNGSFFGTISVSERSETTFRLYWRAHANAWTSLPTGILSQLPLKRLHSLELCWKPPPNSLQVLSSCSPALATVQTLTLSNPYPTSALRDATPTCFCVKKLLARTGEPCLFSPESDDIASAICRACREFSASIFPELRTLKIEALALAQVDVSLLKDFLTHRSNAGRPIERLAVRYDDEREGQFAQLEEMGARMLFYYDEEDEDEWNKFGED